MEVKKNKLEYVWLDGYQPEPTLRSKIKIIDRYCTNLLEVPEWGFDGSSTQQAQGSSSDCVLKPIRLYNSPFDSDQIVLCEVYNADGIPHISNTRANIISEKQKEYWFGFEQEYTLMKNGRPLEWPEDATKYPKEQGDYYCGVGASNIGATGRKIMYEHTANCLKAGVSIHGTNAEVMLGQWEYQVFGRGAKKSADNAWMARYILYRTAEQHGVDVEIEAKPMKIAEFSSVDELSKIFDTKPNDIIQKCMSLGVLATINQRLDWDVIELLSEEFGYIPEKIEDVGEELFTLDETKEDIKKAVERPPVITVMGHVDHGKTSLLDYIRKTNVVDNESGGITQHIGAYTVKFKEDQTMTFLDTPGHEAFTAMRARGAQVTDIVVLVIAANDGVMPQTIEAIDHAKAAKVPLIIAINKIDLPDVDLERIKRELSERDVLVEDWGGKVQAIPISAKSGDGIDDLISSMILETEMLELKANSETLARGTVIDSKLDKGHGPIATVLVQKGTLKVGDPFICNNISGKVRAMMNENGKRVKEAGPSAPVQILGFDQVPQSADIFAVLDNEREIKRIVSERQRLKREIDHRKISAQSLDAMSALIKEGAIKNLPLIIKGDVDGSIEALAEQLEKISNDEVGVQVIHKAVGMVSESDVLLASASKAVIIGFHVQISSNAKLQSKQEGVDIRTYNIIYQAVEDVKLAVEGLLEPEQIEEILGRAVVQQSFKIPKIGVIAGSKVIEGTIIRNGQARVIRNEEQIAEGEITSLKHLKDESKEIREGFECGIGITNFSKYKEDDIIVCYEIKSIKRKLVLA